MKSGKIRITIYAFETCPGYIFKLFSKLKFHPTSKEHLKDTKEYLYTGKSPLFTLPDNIEIPIYDIINEHSQDILLVQETPRVVMTLEEAKDYLQKISEKYFKKDKHETGKN